MRIQHNIAALNSYRQLGNNNNAVAKNLEKLSSGYRINRAGDDAAGLAISEKMRAQITGLETAQKNANDGISLVQTAEGALTEVHSMLNRMVDLANQSANGTYDNEVDRANIQKEVDSLKEEIDRISEGTNYNGIQLLDGSLGETSKAGGNISDGGKVAFISGKDLNVKSIAAQKNTFAATAAVSVASGSSLSISYSVSGKTITHTLYNSSTDPVNMDVLINRDETLNKLFAAALDGKTIVSRVAGSEGAIITDVKNGAASVNADPALCKTGTDAALMFTPPSSGTFTIGDKIFEVVSTAGKAKAGNIEIVKKGVATAAIVVDALKMNGIKSASISGNNIIITDLNEISVDAKGTGVSVDANAGTVLLESATKHVFDVSSQFEKTGTSGVSQTLTVSVIDENGDTQKIEVSYSSSSTGTDNENNILTALGNDSEFGKYFDIDKDTKKIIAKEAGANGAKLAGFTTTDKATAIGGKFDFTTDTVGQDNRKTLELSNVNVGTKVTVNGKTYEFVDEGRSASGDNIAVTVGSTASDSAKNLSNALKADGISVSRDDNKLIFSNEGGSVSGENGGLVLQVGDTAEDFNKVTVKVGNMSAKALGISSIDVKNQTSAAAAVDKIKAAINTVSSTRGDLGAIQNRLEHTINNLGVTTENMTAAESRIRDVDIAQEMMTYTKNNILTQSAQAMLAQANQLPQGVLQLLQ